MVRSEKEKKDKGPPFTCQTRYFVLQSRIFAPISTHGWAHKQMQLSKSSSNGYFFSPDRIPDALEMEYIIEL